MSRPMLRMVALSILVGACSAEGAGAADGNGGTTPPRADRTPPDACRGSFDYENCVAFLPTERMRGVWITGFEQSSFIPGPAALPDPADPRRFRTWLDFASGAPPDPALRRALDETRRTMVVAIEFDGRRSRDAGGYGHLGTAEHVVIVDRIVSARILGPMPSVSP